MTKTLLITFPGAAADSSLVHRFRNFAEEVYRQFTPLGIAELPDMNSAVAELHITVPATRHLGTVSVFVTKALRRHGLSELTKITKLH